MRNKQLGFTLVELLIVIAVIAILAAVAFVAIDPATRFAEARNSQRWSDVTSILESVQQYVVDNKGTMPSGIASGETRVIGDGATGTCAACAAVAVEADGDCAKLSTNLEPRYFANIPVDPDTGSDNNSQYYITLDAQNHITIGACAPEEIRGEAITISATR